MLPRRTENSHRLIAFAVSLSRIRSLSFSGRLSGFRRRLGGVHDRPASGVNRLDLLADLLACHNLRKSITGETRVHGGFLTQFSLIGRYDHFDVDKAVNLTFNKQRGTMTRYHFTHKLKIIELETAAPDFL